MLLQAINKYQIDPNQSLMLGDKKADMQAAKAARVARKVLVLSGQTLTAEDQASADEVWPSIKAALELVTN
jgi:D-glycero-D-manno-heptose 1,7-bisphosphate phosphatase